MPPINGLIAAWMIGFIVLCGLAMLIVAGPGAFSRDRDSLHIYLPFTVTTGICGLKALMIPVFVAYVSIPLAILVYSKLHRIDPFIDGCLGFFTVMAMVAMFATLKPSRISLEPHSISMARLSIITGQPISKEFQSFQISEFDRVTLMTGSGRGGVGIGIGDINNPQKVGFLVPSQLSPAKSLAQEIGRAYGWPVYVNSGFSTRILQ